MTLSPPERGPLTTYLLLQATLTLAALTVPVLVGDGEAPENSGWTKGQPGAEGSDFIPYGVLRPVPAQAPGRQPVGDSDQAWVFDYVWTGWGAIREQADYAADQGTKALTAIGKVAPADSPIEPFGLQLIELLVIGAPERTDQVQPPLWSRADTIRVRVARARTR